MNICSNPQCSILFVPKQGSTGKYCSRSCAAKVNNEKFPKRQPERTCPTCATPVKSDRRKGGGFCEDCKPHISQAERTLIVRQSMIQDWLNGDWNGGGNTLSRVVRDYLLKEAKMACSSCGFDTPHPDDGKTILEIDHINGNGTDHRPENLSVLCPNCHALTSTYRARNLGNGRPVKYIRVPVEDEHSAGHPAREARTSV